MKKTRFSRFCLLMTLALLFGALPVLSAEDRFYIDKFNIEPGETRYLSVFLENEQAYYGFQADFTLPDGLEFVLNGGQADCKLSSRADNSYSLVSNLTSSSVLRVGAFSTTHSAFTGGSGVLLQIKVKADDAFTGGEIKVNNVLMVTVQDTDKEMPDFSIAVGTTHNDRCFISDFKISVGETKTVAIELENETQFTAFQTDIYMPQGLTIVDNSFRITERGTGNHQLTSKSFDDGRTRLVCFSTGNDIISADNGAIVLFDVTADISAKETSSIELKNLLFSKGNANEYRLPNSSTTVTTERALVTSVVMSEEAADIVVGETKQLSAEIMPEYASYKELKWESSDTSVATVDANGIVTAVAPGSTVISATAKDGSGVSATCNITVSLPPLTGITLNSTEVGLKATETFALTATFVPSNAADKSITWSSSDDAVAKVDETGLITAVSVGTVVISVVSTSNPDIKAECTVTVHPTPVETINLNVTNVSLKVNGTSSLSASVSPATVTNKEVVWTSSNESVAVVSPEGVVTALSLGEAVITATAADGSGVSATCTVTVVATGAESIAIETPSSDHFKVGEIISLVATVLPEDATDKTVTWSSDNTDVATVDGKGVVSAVGVGTVVITATNSAGQSAQVTLTVDETLVSEIVLSSANVSLKVKGTSSLSASVSPSTVTNKEVVWTSSNESVAVVSPEGVVTALSLGEAVITATAADGSGVSATCTVTVVATGAESIAIETPSSDHFKVGESISLVATVLPEDATDKTVTWSSDNTDVATVDENGVVSAVGVGTVVITATNSAGQSAQVTLTVDETLVSEIVLSSANVSLKVNGTSNLSASVSPATVTNKEVVWTSSNESVAVVSPEGVVTALSLGEAVITATAADGSGVSATCTVTVVATGAESIAIETPSSDHFKVGEIISLVATVLSEDATDKTVTWSSDNTDVATVDENGVVSAVGVGTVVITATNSAGQSAQVTLTVERTLVMGDVNNDNVVDINDITATISHILGGAAAGLFDEESADIINDGIIDINDITKMISMILSGE